MSIGIKSHRRSNEMACGKCAPKKAAKPVAKKKAPVKKTKK